MANRVPGPDPLHTLMKAMMEGIPELPTTLTSISVLGTTYTMADLTAKLGTFEPIYAAADKAAQDKDLAFAARDKADPEAREFVMATAVAFKVALGRTSATLRKVGVTPDKLPTPLTTDQKTVKVAKGKATRIARHTMGKKAKSKITGQAPVTAPAPTKS